MAGGEINVAYDGTFADLGGVAADPALFGVNDNFDFNKYFGDGGVSDGFTAINANTISPKDVFNDSIPPSSSFTNLTTPGSTFIETPDEEYQTSPLFDNVGMDASVEGWYSLFPESDLPTTGGATMARSTSAASGSHIMVHPGGEANRKRSSTNNASVLSSPVMKHSSVAGVAARKRDKPLPPIMVDESDPVALKRARNTAAARKSRAKKVEERDVLESQIADLKAQVQRWKSLAIQHGASPEMNSDDE